MLDFPNPKSKNIRFFSFSCPKVRRSNGEREEEGKLRPEEALQNERQTDRRTNMIRKLNE